MNAVADKLRQARALVERGWMQGDYADADCECFCALGAIQMAVCGEPDNDFSLRTRPLEQLFQQALGVKSIVNWNDANGRTQAEVLAAFDKAIELAEQSLPIAGERK
jgi:hypothetical protein